METTMTELGLEVPIVEERARRRSRFRQAWDALNREGPFLPQHMLPYVLELSKQRVSELIGEGRIPTFEIDGKKYVPIEGLEAFLSEERKNGRPVKEFDTLRDAYRSHGGVRQVYRNEVDRIKKSRK
jgi:hypothetical protein